MKDYYIWIGLYIQLHLSTYMVFMYILAEPHMKHQKNKQISIQFKAFKRLDIDNWGIFKCFPYYITFWPRAILILINVFIYFGMVVLLMIGASEDEFEDTP